jgi:N-acetylneuraminic acid mutarotase
MYRGAAVVDGNMAYFMNCDGEVCSYNVSSKKWNTLPKYPFCDSSLAIINGHVTAIGGCKHYTHTNQLLSVQGYKEVFPPMPTKRRGTTAMTSKEHLVVAGGTTGAGRLSTVEVMDTNTLVWSTVASLPHPGPYSDASGTILFGDQLYILGGVNDRNTTKSVLTCSLTELLQSSPSSSYYVWHRVADAPAHLSTCAAVNGELLAVGGHDQDRKSSSAIHKYNPTTNSWDLISNMPTARYESLVAVLPTNDPEMMVVGGTIYTYTCTTSEVEVAHFSLQRAVLNSTDTLHMCAPIVEMEF